MAGKDLITEYRLAAAEYVQWLEAAKERFEDTNELGAILQEMHQGCNLYGWLVQKGVYEYRVKPDPEIWREIQRRYAEQVPRLMAAAEALSVADRAEFDRMMERMNQYHQELVRAMEDWYFKEQVRKEEKAKNGCLGIFTGTLAILVVPWVYWWSC